MAQSTSRVPSDCKLLGGTGSSGAKLDTHFWLGLESGTLHLLHQAQPVINRNGDKAAGDFEDVEAHVATLLDVAVHDLRPLREHMLDEASGGDLHIVAMGKLDDFL